MKRLENEGQAGRKGQRERQGDHSGVGKTWKSMEMKKKKISKKKIEKKGQKSEKISPVAFKKETTEAGGWAKGNEDTGREREIWLLQILRIARKKNKDKTTGKETGRRQAGQREAGRRRAR